mmetsp:Transcript_12401/g.29289  ORF Transcript_12401/g.29289 Transcript_12401/m.29289 type:complete len:96 (+) Transcript_12401:40-327(+)
MLSDIRGQLVGASSDSTVMPAVVTTCASGSSCSFWPTTLISWGLLPSESLRLPLLLEEEEELDDEELLDDELPGRSPGSKPDRQALPCELLRGRC